MPAERRDKIPKDEKVQNTIKKRQSDDSSMRLIGVWRWGKQVQLNPKGDDSDWKLETTLRIGDYMGTNFAYAMLCETYNSLNEYNKGGSITGNHIVA